MKQRLVAHYHLSSYSLFSITAYVSLGLRQTPMHVVAPTAMSGSTSGAASSSRTLHSSETQNDSVSEAESFIRWTVYISVRSSDLRPHNALHLHYHALVVRTPSWSIASPLISRSRPVFGQVFLGNDDESFETTPFPVNLTHGTLSNVVSSEVNGNTVELFLSPACLEMFQKNLEEDDVVVRPAECFPADKLTEILRCGLQSALVSSVPRSYYHQDM